MSELGDAFVRIRPNFTGFNAEAEGGLKKSLKHVAEVVGVAYGAKAAFEFGKRAAEDAAAVQKSTEVIRAQFGEAGEALIKFSENAGIHLGIAGHESAAVSARFGILFKNLGVGKEEAAKMTLNMEKLGGSIAALRGIDPTTVLERLPIALAGNIRGLKQLGISIDAQLVKQTALELGYGKTTKSALKDRLATDAVAIAKANLANAESKYGSNTTQVTAARDKLAAAEAKMGAAVKQTLSALTPAQRAQVIYTIATKHLDDFQKQAAAHAGDFANVQRRLSAEWDHAKETLGAALLPTLTKYADELGRWISKMDKSGALQRDFNSIVKDAVGVMQGLVFVVKIAWGAFNILSDALGGAKNTMIAFFAAIAVGKILSLTKSIVEGLVGTGLKTLGVATAEEGTAYVATFGRMELATLGLRTTIVGLLGPIGLVSAAVGALLILMSRTKDGVGSTPVGGTPGVNATTGSSITRDEKGQYYARVGGRYYPISDAVALADIKKFGTVATSVTAADAKGGSRGIGGVVRGSGDFKDETLAFRSALSALAKQVGDINLFSGYRNESAQTTLWDASVKAGHPGFMPNGNPIARPASRGGTGSPHTAGVAGDGTIRYQGKWIPLSSLPPSILARFGLTTVTTASGRVDVNHVQLVGGAVVPSSSISLPSSTGSGISIPDLTVGSVAKKTAALTTVQLGAARASLHKAYASIKDTAAQLGTGLTAAIKKQMAEARKDISDVATTKDVAKAKTELDTLRTEVSKKLALLKQHIAQTAAFDSLKTAAAKLGEDTTPQIEAAMKKIRDSIGKATTPQTEAAIKSQMTRVRALIATQLELIKAHVQQMQTTFEGAWSRIANSADSAFDRATSKALAALQVMVNAAGSSFLFGGGIAQTPAEIALAQLQASHQAAQDSKALSDAQSNLATAQKALSDLMVPDQASIANATLDYNKISAQIDVAQTKLEAMQADRLHKFTPADIALQQATINSLQGNADTAQSKLTALLGPTDETKAAAQQAILDATATVNDLLYNSKVTALQTQADLERTAAAQQLTDAQNAYSAQRDLLKQQMDDRVEAIRVGMENGSIAADAGMQLLTDVFGDPKYGIDIYNGGLVIGSTLYSGLKDGLQPVFDMLNNLIALMKRAGIKLPNAPAITGGTALTPALAAGSIPQVGRVYFAPDDPIAQSLLAEAKKTNEILSDPATVVVNTGVSSQVLAAMR